MLPPTEIVFPLSANVPLVNVKLPAIEIAEFTVIVAGVVLVLLIVKLLNAVTLEGILNGPAFDPPKDKSDDEVVAKLVAVPAIAPPFNANVFVPTVNVPVVKVSVPVIVGLAAKVKPPELFTSRFETVIFPVSDLPTLPVILILPVPV